MRCGKDNHFIRIADWFEDARFQYRQNFAGINLQLRVILLEARFLEFRQKNGELSSGQSLGD